MSDWHKEFAWLPVEIGTRKVWLGRYAWRELDKEECEEPKAPVKTPVFANYDERAAYIRCQLTLRYMDYTAASLGHYQWREFSLPDGYLVWGKRFVMHSLGPGAAGQWEWIGT
jgi:hypothetical protein